LQRLARNGDFSGWVVVVLFVLFVLSIVVYRVASSAFPEVEAVAESPGTPLPAGPRKTEPVIVR
jgi:hypothetical protein